MKLISIINKYKKQLVVIFVLAILGPLTLIAACYYKIEPYKKFILTEQNMPHFQVGIVLGAGIAKNGKPYQELQARLDKAADALNDGKVDKLILSGDNRFVDYNEPEAMKQYLTKNRKISAQKLVLDYAGRSTYESCERAIKIFEVKQIVIFSAHSHLPRAVYLCRHFNIESFGISSGVEANNSTRRELLARVKAIYNTQVVGERTVLGSPIPID